jgi:hypothetical protein
MPGLGVVGASPSADGSAPAGSRANNSTDRAGDADFRPSGPAEADLRAGGSADPFGEADLFADGSADCFGEALLLADGCADRFGAVEL